MKKLMTIILAVFLFTAVSESYATSYSVKGGLNLANMTAKDDDGTYSDDFDNLMGLQLGATAEFAINKNFTFETGLLYATKGYKMSYEFFGVSSDTKMILHYLDIPLTAKYYYTLNQDIKVYGILGPYLGYGLSGTAKSDSDGDSEDEDIKFGSGDEEFSPLDYGLLLGIGAEYKKFQFGISYGLGLANLSNVDDNGRTMSNKVISVTVGYRLK